MPFNSPVFSCGLEHCSHRDVRLLNRAIRIFVTLPHFIHHFLTVVRQNFIKLNISHHRLDIQIISFTVVSLRIVGAICNNIIKPEFKPLINRHIAKRYKRCIAFHDIFSNCIKWG